MPTYDYHVHSNYSDGRFLWHMLSAAEEAGLDGVGVADHCNVSEREQMRQTKFRLGFNLDQSYERRREALDSMRDRFDLQVFDAVEMDYDPRDEAAIEAFLAEAAFEYAIGSVHFVDDVNVQFRSYFESKPDAKRRAAVDGYFDALVSLVESELFEIAAHADLVERNPFLRGYATDDHYERVAAALAESRTVPELNAGRALTEDGDFHPAPGFVETLREYDVDFVVGSDAHDPEEVAPRAAALDEFVDEHGLSVTRVV